MASGNMMVTLTAQTSNFQRGMRKAGDSVDKFGKLALGIGGLGVTAILSGIAALANFIPDVVAMGEEARKADRKLRQLADTSGVFGKYAREGTTRMQEFAEATMMKVGVDDEVIKSAQGILLTFKAVAKSANLTGDIFDRATVAAADLAAAGFGDIEGNAKQLGKALQDPLKGLTALTRSGVTFTQAEKKKIRALVEANDLYAAQGLIMKAVESQVGGTAEAAVSDWDKVKLKFEDLQEQIGTALLPAVDTLGQKFADWLESPEGKQALEDFVQKFEDFSTWITSEDGQATIEDLVDSIETLLGFLIGVADVLETVHGWFKKVGEDAATFRSPESGNVQIPSRGGVLEVPGSAVEGKSSSKFSSKGITVNFNTPVDSVSAGKSVARVLKDYNRMNGRR
jgi:hypothetical protein